MIVNLSFSLPKPQLDESKAYGEMVEALTTKNLEIGERCGELEATVVDLESSVELSEELEMQQTEDIRDLRVCTMTDELRKQRLYPLQQEDMLSASISSADISIHIIVGSLKRDCAYCIILRHVGETQIDGHLFFWWMQAEISRRDVMLHSQKLVLESVVKELEDTKQTIDRFRYA